MIAAKCDRHKSQLLDNLQKCSHAVKKVETESHQHLLPGFCLKGLLQREFFLFQVSCCVNKCDFIKIWLAGQTEFSHDTVEYYSHSAESVLLQIIKIFLTFAFVKSA